MSRIILGAAGAVAGAALLLAHAPQAAAQNTGEKGGVSVGSPHETPAETTNQQGNRANQQPNRDNQQDYQEQAPDESGTQQRSDRQQSTGDESNRQRNDRAESGRRDRDRDLQSQIRFDESTEDGLKISRVDEGSHYYRSGLRNGDVIISYNGQPLRNQDEFGRWANERSRERTPVIVLRDGRRETVYIQSWNDRSQNDRGDQRSYANTAGQYQSQAYLGVRFESRQRGGAVISAVVPGSPAEEAGLKPGDELVSINGRKVNSPREVTRFVASLQPGDKIDIEYSRPTSEHAEAVLKEHPGDVASARYQESERNWQGATQYDGIEQSSYDEESTTGAANEYRSGETIGRGGERRGGGLFQRLRN